MFVTMFKMLAVGRDKFSTSGGAPCAEANEGSSPKIEDEKEQLIRRLAEVSASEARYRALVEHSNDSIIVVSGSKLVYVNSVTARLCGYDSPEDLIGRDALSFIPEGYRGEYRDRIAARLRGEPQPIKFEHEVTRRDGSTVPTETMASLIDYGGEPAVLFMARDITERKRFEGKLFALHEHAAQLGSSETMVDVSEAAIGAIKSVMGFGMACFLLNEGESLRCISSTDPEAIFGETPLAGEGPVPTCARERGTVLVNELREGSVSCCSGVSVRSVLATPVLLHGELEAVISVQSVEAGAFKDEDAQILEIIGRHVATALERISRVG